MNEVTRKVSAYIVRESDKGYDELLVFSHKNYPDVPLQIPGGTVENDENFITALKREIYEETGLTDYSIIKELGEIFYSNELNEKFNRHFYLVRVPKTTNDIWEHEVSGKGEDNGLIFSYSWYDPQKVLLICKRDRQFLSRKFIPLLFSDEVMLGLSNKKVSLMPDDEYWREKFRNEKKIIQEKIKDKNIVIEHIGSTAIPEIPAKPIIDIGIGIYKSTNIEGLVKSLEEVGYIHKGENGISGRYYFVKGKPENRKFHIHMFEVNHPDWKNHLLFRDYLIDNVELAKEYGELKLKNWKLHMGNRKGYTDSKNSFIKKILKKAKKDKKIRG